jgi:TM2 domain-containing membrane protein YozV
MDGHLMNPILVAISSLLIPGLGQLLVGDIKRGIIIFILFAIICAVSSLAVQSGRLPDKYWIIFPGLVEVLASWDAYKLAVG